MNQNKLNTFLKKEVENDLRVFIRDNVPSAPEIGTSFPDHLKDWKEIDGTVEYYYPRKYRDGFGREDGLKIEEYNDIDKDRYMYKGNLSIMVKLIDPGGRSKIKKIGYSYCFWYCTSSYKLLRKGSDLHSDELPFSFRLDWGDEDGVGIAHHSHFIHTMPRLHSKKLSVKVFLEYIHAEILPMTGAVEDKMFEHMADY